MRPAVRTLIPCLRATLLARPSARRVAPLAWLILVAFSSEEANWGQDSRTCCENRGRLVDLLMARAWPGRPSLRSAPPAAIRTTGLAGWTLKPIIWRRGRSGAGGRELPPSSEGRFTSNIITRRQLYLRGLPWRRGFTHHRYRALVKKEPHFRARRWSSTRTLYLRLVLLFHIVLPPRIWNAR